MTFFICIERCFFIIKTVIMQKATASIRKPFLSVLAIFFCLLVSYVFQSCEKSIRKSDGDPVATKKKPNNPPPPPAPFYFYCANPTITGNFVVGAPTNATLTLNYFNSPGGPYPSFTSATVNGITLTVPAGALNVGSGSILFTASGTPLNSGVCMIGISIAGSPLCNLVISVLNAPPSAGNCAEPSPSVGSTGCVTFTYRGQSVTYSTVRAADGKIWLQQNLGSPQVAAYETDQASYGDYFQWGRWDDGHQLANSPTITQSSSLENPSHIAGGNLNFIKNSSASVGWWNTGTPTDTWSGTLVSVTNGKDPCATLGAGWRMPSRTDWQNVSIGEDITSIIDAFQSRLKLPSSGYRLSYGAGIFQGSSGAYWTSTANGGGTAYALTFDNLYVAPIEPSYRGQGYSCRCVKD